MSLEKNKAIVRRLFEVYNEKNLDLLDKFLAPDYIDHLLKLRNLESFKQFYAQFYKGFPDTHSTIEDIIAEGDKVWARVTYTGTHTGDYLGFAPTGKKISINSVTIKRVVDGKMVEGWTISDMLDFFKQIGLIEPTEQAKTLFLEDAK